MSISTSQYIKAHSTASVSISNTAGGGSVVSVKVLRNNGGGSYTVSFAGNKYSVKSNIPLKEGQVFKATVKYDGQKIILEQRGQTPAVLNLTEDILLADGMPGEQLSAYLSQIGLVPDKVTVSIMQFLQQNGFKLDFSLIQKARLLAMKFPGNEKKAADAALLLMENGISGDEEIIRCLLNIFAGQDNGYSSDRGDRPLGQNQQNLNQGDRPLDFTSFLYTNSISGKENLLAFMNHYAKNNNHWIFLPYEWDFGKQKVTGFIKLFLDITEKKVNKMQINADFSVKKYYFVLKFIQSKVKEVRFCTLPSLLPSEINSEELRLGGFFNSGMNSNYPVAVTYSTLALQEGICTECMPPVFIEEEA